MTLRPSETEQGRLWLNNFLPEEHHAAELLINSLRVISETTFRIVLTEILIKIKADSKRPVAFYPVRQLPREVSAPEKTEEPVEREKLPNGKYMALLPLDHPFEAIPGSEALVGNIIRDVIGRKPIPAVASSPESLQELRQVAASTIVLVDDYSGTGTTIRQYVDAWMRHPTVRSWHSYGKIRFHVALLTASGMALEALEKHRWIERVHYLERAADFSTALWSEAEHTEIEALCAKYAYSNGWKFGFEEAKGLLVLQHTVPNNLPAILWQDWARRKKGDWNPFFGERRMTPQLQLDLDDYKLEVSATEIANSMQQARLGKALSEQPNPTVRLILLTLAAAAQRIRDPEKLSNVLRTTIVSAEQTQAACRSLNLLDEEGRLTDLGRKELRRARARADNVSRTRLLGRTGVYYPTQLRGVSNV